MAALLDGRRLDTHPAPAFRTFRIDALHGPTRQVHHASPVFPRPLNPGGTNARSRRRPHPAGKITGIVRLSGLCVKGKEILYVAVRFQQVFLTACFIAIAKKPASPEPLPLCLPVTLFDS